jgi:hypothetical protein
MICPSFVRWCLIAALAANNFKLPNGTSLNIHIDYTDSQIPSYEDDLYCDPDRSTLRLSTGYPIEIYAS